MKIAKLRVNHLENPFGFQLSKPTFSFCIEESTGTALETVQLQVAQDPDMAHIVYDSTARSDISPLGFIPDYEFKGGTRYYWTITAVADNQDTGTSSVAWFEGGKGDAAWQGEWITSPFDKEQHPLMFTGFSLPCAPEEVASARLYICGLGLYEAYLNGQKIGDEYLTPFYNDYNYWIQYQTYDPAGALQAGENTLSVMLGNGWYKGRFGFDSAIQNLYGDQYLLRAELHITDKEGNTTLIKTDGTWQCVPSAVRFSNIYDGEIYDAQGFSPSGDISPEALAQAKGVLGADAPKGTLRERLSPPLRIHERLAPQALIITPKGEQVIDFGQEITGWVEFDCQLPKGERVYLQFGEILQEDCFYQENYRTAKAEYTFLANGEQAHVRPHFTFYGFRYMKVEGLALTEENLADFHFEACAIYSSLETTGRITTSNPKLNRLLANALWSQKDNFLDVPTDCPQRDERMGWTGDAQAFCATASYFMDTAAFYRKYLEDMRFEQRDNHGAVPHVVPDVLNIIRRKLGQKESDFANGEVGDAASCAWADAATIIPWTVYTFYGDKALLEESYENMTLWTDFIRHMDDHFCDGSRLWSVGFHFADWLALDNPDKESSFGGTDPYYVASAYYLYSASLTAKAAKVLGREADAARYGQLAEEVRAAMRKKYLLPDGRLTIDTQTALVLAIYLDIMPEAHMQQAADALRQKLEEAQMHLTTGFVGTAYLCMALTKAGMAEEAYTLLFQEDYPSWLYEVNMGATTIWERWNSVLPDGKISGTGMNSLNHYAYGAVSEWIFRTVCGIAPDPEAPGFARAIMAPIPDRRLTEVQGEYNSASGRYASGWRLEGDKIHFEVLVPFSGQAQFMVPQGIDLLSVDGSAPESPRSFILSHGRHALVGQWSEARS